MTTPADHDKRCPAAWDTSVKCDCGAADLPEALRSIQRFEVVDCIDDNHVPAAIPKPHGPWVRYADHVTALAAGQATAAPAGGVVAYLDIGAGGYLDLGSDLSNEALSRLPKGRHALIVAGTYGIDGYTPTPPAPAQPVELDQIEQYRMQMAGISTAASGYWKEGDAVHADYLTPALIDVARLYAKYDELYRAMHVAAPAAQPDSVQDDAALLHYALSDGGNQSMNWQDIFDDWDGDGYFIDALRAARKQGEKQ